MARPTKQGIDYFPFDVGFFGDKNVRILKARYRSDGIAVYIKLLCDIYKEGYFLPVESWDDYIFVIADEITISSDKVEQIIAFLQNRAMVRVFKKDELTGCDLDAVITSHGIQKRYATAMKSRRKKSIDEIKRGFWLLTEQEETEINAFYKGGTNEGFSENNPSFSEKNTNKSEKNPIKENKIKEKEIYKNEPRARETDSAVHNLDERNEREREKFLKRYSALRMDSNVDDSNVNYALLTDCFERSKKHLQSACSFSWVIRHYEDIINGKFEDYPEKVRNNSAKLPPAVQAVNDRADRERFYAARKNKAQAVADRTYEKAMRSPNFINAEKGLKTVELELAKAEINTPDKVPEIKAKKAQLLKERRQALAVLGLTEADLQPKWHCEKCEDTGYIKQSGAACDCYKKEELE